jgi:hypothetical protein
MRVLQITGLALLWVWTGVQGATIVCSVSSGDKGVGISAVEEPACPVSGGLGCFGDGNPCRLCMVVSSPLSSHLAACRTTTAAPTVTPTVAPTPTPTTANSTPSVDDCAEGYTIA